MQWMLDWTPVAVKKQREIISFICFELNYFPNRDKIWDIHCQFFLLLLLLFFSIRFYDEWRDTSFHPEMKLFEYFDSLTSFNFIRNVLIFFGMAFREREKLNYDTHKRYMRWVIRAMGNSVVRNFFSKFSFSFIRFNNYVFDEGFFFVEDVFLVVGTLSQWRAGKREREWESNAPIN